MNSKNLMAEVAATETIKRKFAAFGCVEEELERLHYGYLHIADKKCKVPIGYQAYVDEELGQVIGSVAYTVLDQENVAILPLLSPNAEVTRFKTDKNFRLHTFVEGETFIEDLRVWQLYEGKIVPVFDVRRIETVQKIFSVAGFDVKAEDIVLADLNIKIRPQKESRIGWCFIANVGGVCVYVKAFHGETPRVANTVSISRVRTRICHQNDKFFTCTGTYGLDKNKTIIKLAV